MEINLDSATAHELLVALAQALHAAQGTKTAGETTVSVQIPDAVLVAITSSDDTQGDESTRGGP